MCQKKSKFIIEIDTYTSELKSKPLMPWLIGSATPVYQEIQCSQRTTE